MENERHTTTAWSPSHWEMCLKVQSPFKMGVI